MANKPTPKAVQGFVKDDFSFVKDLIKQTAAEMKKEGVVVNPKSDGFQVNINYNQTTTGGSAVRKDLQLTEQQIKSTLKAKQDLEKSLTSKQKSTGIDRMNYFLPALKLLEEAAMDFDKFVAAQRKNGSQKSKKTSASGVWSNLNAYQAMTGSTQEQALGNFKSLLTNSGVDSKDIQFGFDFLKTDFPNTVTNSVNVFHDVFRDVLMLAMNQDAQAVSELVVSMAEKFNATHKGDKGYLDLEGLKEGIEEQINSVLNDNITMDIATKVLFQGVSQTKHSDNNSKQTVAKVQESIEQRKEFLNKYIVKRDEFQTVVTQLVQEEQQLLQEAEKATSTKMAQDLRAQAKQKRAEIYKYIAGQKAQPRGEVFAYNWFKDNYGKDNEYMSGFRTARKNSLIGQGVSQDWAENQVRDIFDIEHWGVSTWDEAANQTSKMGAKLLSNITNMAAVLNGLDALEKMAKADNSREYGFINKGDTNTEIIQGEDGSIVLSSLLKGKEGKGAQISLHSHNGQAYAFPSKEEKKGDISNWFNLLTNTFGENLEKVIHGVLADPTLGDEIALFNPSAVPKDIRKQFVAGLSNFKMDPYAETPSKRLQQGLRNYIQDFGLANFEEIFQVMKASDFKKITNASIQQGLHGGSLIPDISSSSQASAQEALIDAINEDTKATRAETEAKMASTKSIEASTQARTKAAQQEEIFEPRTEEDIKKELDSKELIPLSVMQGGSKKERSSFWNEIGGAYGGLKKSGNSISALDRGINLIDKQLEDYLRGAIKAYNEQKDMKLFEAEAGRYQGLKSIKEYYSQQLEEALAKDFKQKINNFIKRWTESGELKDQSIESFSGFKKLDESQQSQYDRLPSRQSKRYNEDKYTTKLDLLKQIKKNEEDEMSSSFSSAFQYYKEFDRSTTESPLIEKYALQYAQAMQNIAKLDEEIAYTQNRYDKYLAERAAESEAIKEQQEAKTDKDYSQFSSDEVRTDVLSRIDNKSYKAKTLGEYMDRREASMVFSEYDSIEQMIERIAQARREAEADQEAVLQQLTTLYNENGGNVDIPELQSKLNGLLQEFYDYHMEYSSIDSFLTGLYDYQKTAEKAPKEEILNQLNDYEHLLPSLSEQTDDIFKDWGAEYFKNDRESTIKSFSEALTRLKTQYQNEKVALEDNLVSAFNDAKILGKDPWESRNVLENASSLKYYENGIKAFEDRLAKLKTSYSMADVLKKAIRPALEGTTSGYDISDFMKMYKVPEDEEGFKNLNDKLYQYMSAFKKSMQSRNKVLADMTELYNTSEGEESFDEVDSVGSKLLMQFQMYDEAKQHFLDIVLKLKAQVKEQQQRDKILKELNAKDFDTPKPDEIFKEWNAETFENDIDKTVESFKTAFQNLKTKEAESIDKLMYMYRAEEMAGRDPWESSYVTKAATEAQHYIKSTAIFDEKINQLMQAKNEADTVSEQAGEKAAGSFAWTDETAGKIDQLATNVASLVEVIKQLQQAFATLDQSKGAKGILDTLSNISTLLQQGLSSQITEYTNKTKQLFDLNREFSTALAKSGEPATIQLDQWMQKEWTDVSKLDNLQWNIQQFEALQKIAEKTGFEFGEFEQKYKTITSQIEQPLAQQSPFNEYINQLDIVIKKLETVAELMSSAFSQATNQGSNIGAAERSNRGLDSLMSKAYTSAEYQALDKKRKELRNEYDRLEKERENISFHLPKEQWSEDDNILVSALGKQYAPINPEWSEARQKSEAVHKEWENVIAQLNKVLLAEEPTPHLEDFKSLTTAAKEKYTGFRKGDTGTSTDISKAYVVEMSPEEYLARCAAMFNDTQNSQTNLTMQIRGLDRSQVDNLKEKIQKGEQMYTPWLDERGINGQEGRHRAAAAYELGLDKIPVVYWPKDESRIPQTPEVSTSSKDISPEISGFSELKDTISRINDLLTTKNTLIDDEVQKAEAIQGEAANFEPLKEVLETINTLLTNIVTNLPNVKAPSSIVPTGNVNNANNTVTSNNVNTPNSSNNQASNSPISSGSNTPTPQNPLPVAIYSSPAGTIKSQQGYSEEEGSTFIKRTGWASEQTYQYTKDDDDNIVLEKFGDERMNYDSLSKQIAKVDEQILKLDHDMAQIQNKYPNIDLTPWKQQRVALGEMRKSMLQEAKRYGTRPEYEPNYRQFKQQRLQSINRVVADLQKQTNVASEKELLEVQHKQSQLQQRAASIHAGLHGTSQYQDVLSQIASATSLTDIENADKALNRLKATIEQLKGQAKNVSGSLDPLQNMFKTRDLKGQFYINELITKFEKLGLDGKAKVAPLQGILDQWNKIDINALDIGDGTGRNGLQAFGDYIESFNKQRYTLEAEVKAAKAQQQVKAKKAGDEKKMDVDNYKQLLAAIQNVIDAQRQLQTIQKESSKDQSGIIDYTKKIDDAKVHLDLMKDSLKSVLDTIYGKTSLSDLTPDFFTNPANGNLLNPNSLSPSQLRAFGKAQAKMTGTEEQYNESQLKAVAAAYTEVTSAVNAYNKAAGDIHKSSDVKLMGELQQNVESASKSYYDLINNVGQLIPQFTDRLNQFKQNNPIRELFDKEAISNTLLTRLELVKESLQGLADVNISANITNQISQIDNIANSFTNALANSKSTKDIFSAFTQANTDLHKLNVEPIIKDLLKVQSVLSNLGDDARSNVWTDHLNKIGQVINNMTDTTDPAKIQAYRNQLDGLLNTAKEIASPTLMQNKQGFLLNEGEIKSVTDMTNQMDKYAEAMQLGSLATEKWNVDHTKVTRTYKATSGQITQLTGQVEQLSNAWRMSSTVSQGSNAFMTGFSKSLGGVIRQLPQLVMGYSAIMKIRSELTAGMNTFKEYDSTLTNISYTMNMTSKELDTLGKSAIDMAKDLSMSVSNAEGVYKIYANMNTSAEEIQKLAKPTVILSNLSGVDASTAADEVQGIIQQFDMLKNAESDAADVSMHVVDVLNDISANVAMDYSFN